MFNLIDEIKKREIIIAENDANKAAVAELEKQLAEAKAKVRDDEQIRVLGVEIEQIKSICYQLGVLEKPVVEVEQPAIEEIAEIEVADEHLVKPAVEEE